MSAPAAAAPSSQIVSEGAAAQPSIDPATDPDHPSIVQARLTIGPRAGAHDAFVDLEIQGPLKKAMGACNAMVKAELSQKLPDDADLVVRLLRPCSPEAMAEPESAAAWALVQVEHLDSADLTLRFASVPKDEAESLRVRRRTLSGFGDETSCQAMAARLHEAEARADLDAREAERRWLRRTIEQQENTAAKECRIPSAARCKQARLLIKLLRERRDRASQEPSHRASRSTLCRAR